MVPSKGRSAIPIDRLMTETFGAVAGYTLTLEQRRTLGG